MKKILTGVLALFMGASVAMAQTPATQQAPAKAEHRSEKPGQKAQRPALDSTSGKPVKKDGTPDKRFKENKETKENKAQGPVKKDGTPDKRFKENKEAKTEGPKKADGTPDKRFKENKEKKAEAKKA
ncbi:hypothetical protein L3C95_04085 [Chitinophaga filiformis]|uniref:hypothetical protein n=1 Tax=Chitinophaga filiformis TaxID=104663 RepID=UPI001F205C46|nr:hypothetical protein [Chitinophaga filiformis]MCF6402038.1 hypothetical protein [Chitinophaga filiformis]